MATKTVKLSVPKELKEGTTLMFAFSPDVSGMWKQYIPTPWKVVSFTTDKDQNLDLVYTAELSFSQAQIDGSKVIPGVSVDTEFQQKTTLAKIGGNYHWSQPEKDTRLKNNQIEAINHTNDVATICVELRTDGEKKVVLAAQKVGDNSAFISGFRPKVQVYATALYAENELLSAQIRFQRPLWEFNFLEADGQEFYLEEDPYLQIVPKHD